MESIKRMREWADDNRDLFLEGIRIWVGVGLFIKGIFFVGAMDRLSWMVDQGLGVMPFGNVFIAHYIAVAHLGFGLMLAAGLLTRLSALAQVPVIAGAVIFVHGPGGLNTEAQTLEFTLLLLFTVVLLSIYGGGRLSADHYLSRASDDLDELEAERRQQLHDSPEQPRHPRTV